MYGIHTVRIESIDKGKAAPVDELQIQGVTTPGLLRKTIVTEASKVIQDAGKSWNPTPQFNEGPASMKSPSNNWKVISPRRHPSARFTEVAGGTAADCAPICCCCCPFGILNLAMLALYKLPAGICCRLLRRRRREWQTLLKKGVVNKRKCMRGGCKVGEVVSQIYPVLNEVENLEDENEVMRLEKEMWDTFYTTGFWRSSSQKDN